MAHLFHVRPWEWPLLTYIDLLGLCGAIDQTRRSMEEANRD